MKHALTKQRKTCPAISLSFDQLELGHMAFYHPVIDRPSETSSHGVFVLFYSSGKGLQFRKATFCNLGEPDIQALSFSFMDHAEKVLNYAISLHEPKDK